MSIVRKWSDPINKGHVLPMAMQVIVGLGIVKTNDTWIVPQSRGRTPVIQYFPVPLLCQLFTLFKLEFFFRFLWTSQLAQLKTPTLKYKIETVTSPRLGKSMLLHSSAFWWGVFSPSMAHVYEFYMTTVAYSGFDKGSSKKRCSKGILESCRLPGVKRIYATLG